MYKFKPILLYGFNLIAYPIKVLYSYLCNLKSSHNEVVLNLLKHLNLLTGALNIKLFNIL